MIISKMKIPLYGIIIVVSILIGMLYVYLYLKEDIKKDRNILYFYLIYITFAFFFGKMYTLLTTLKGNMLTVGLSAYGGLIGVIIGAIVFEKIVPLNGKIIKASILSLPLVYGLTKIACFTSGCCHGILYDGMFKVKYSNMLNEWVFPIQIVETIVFLIIFVICNKLKNVKNIEYITLVLICIFKFSLDFLRYDHMEKFITVNQYFSILLLVITLIVFIIKRKKLRS